MITLGNMGVMICLGQGGLRFPSASSHHASNHHNNNNNNNSFTQAHNSLTVNVLGDL